MKQIISLLTPKRVTYYMDENSTVRQALEKFDAHRFSAVPLINKDGKYAGSISEGDLLRFIKNKESFDIKEMELVKIKDIPIYRSYTALKISATMNDVLKLSFEQNFIPITDDFDTYIGIIKRKEVIKEFASKVDLDSEN